MDLSVRVGPLTLKNPIICGSGEHVLTEAGIRAALAQGVGVVVAKSTNESEAARAQLSQTDYLALSQDWQAQAWGGGIDANILCRSGLQPRASEDWIDAIARRSSNRPAPSLAVGDLHLDLATRKVSFGGQDIELTPTEFSLLEFLMRHAGQLVTRKMLCEHLWDSDWEGATNVIEVHINRLRGKLDKVNAKQLIQTVRGRGYAIRAS